MKWKNEYAIGITPIDEQHKTIFGMCERYTQDLSDGKGEAVFPNFLKSLIEYCDTHFGFEEHCMHVLECPFAEKNKESHKLFSEAIRKFRLRYEVLGFNSADSLLLAETVEQWLAEHICKVDMKLAESVKKKPIE